MRKTSGGAWESYTPAGGGIVETIVAGVGISIDSTDPANPVVTNTGSSPTTIVGITGTKAQFDTAVTDGNIVYQGDVITSLSGDLPFTQIEQIATNRILGRSTAGTGDIEALTATSVPAMIGLGTSDSPQFTGVNVGHATDTTITRVSAGLIAVEGVNLLRTSDVDDTPVNGATTDPVSSNWAFDHAALSASETVVGHVELATVAELNTGTDAGRAVSPDVIAGSNIGTRYAGVTLNGTTALTTSEKAYLRIPAALTGMNLVSVSATVGTGAAGSSSSGTPTFTVKNVTDNNQMLSTSLTVDASEYTSATAVTAAVINASFDDVVTDDLIEVAVTTAGTGVTYATVTLGFRLP
jgi:hypothetical protein